MTEPRVWHQCHSRRIRITVSHLRLRLRRISAFATLLRKEIINPNETGKTVSEINTIEFGEQISRTGLLHLAVCHQKVTLCLARLVLSWLPSFGL